MIVKVKESKALSDKQEYAFQKSFLCTLVGCGFALGFFSAGSGLTMPQVVPT